MPQATRFSRSPVMALAVIAIILTGTRDSDPREVGLNHALLGCDILSTDPVVRE